MTVPDFQNMMLPLLKFLHSGKEYSMSEAEEHLANFFGLTHEERNMPKPSGGESLFHNRLHWAKFYLKKAQMISGKPRGSFRITERGLDVIKDNPRKIDIKYLMKFDDFSKFIKAGKK